jgi:hypothetical protein
LFSPYAIIKHIISIFVSYQRHKKQQNVTEKLIQVQFGKMIKAVLLIKVRVNLMVALKLQTREALGILKKKTTHSKKVLLHD